MTLALIFETIVRTIALTALAGLGLVVFRVHSSTVKLAVWRLVLYASLLMPLASLLPKRAIVPTPPARVTRVLRNATSRLVLPSPMPASPDSRPDSQPVNWANIALRAYALVAAMLLLRSGLGLLRLRHIGADAKALTDIGPEVFETERLAVPVTYGVLQPRILLPADWRTWSNETFDAVLTHERAHIAAHDFLTQCLSKVNRALYWANPLVWWLDRQVATLAEHASDDAALAQVGERPTYAAMLLGFAGRQANLSTAGVAMARNVGGVSSRIDRILDEARSLSRPLPLAIRVALAVAVFAAVIIVGACKLPGVASAQANPPTPPAISKDKGTYTSDHWWWSDRGRQEWVLVTGRGTSMNGGSEAQARARSMAARIHGDYLWFTHDGKEYLLDDAKTLAEIESWFAPMEELGRKQGELGEKQGKLGEQMAKLGEEMAKLGEQMSHVRVDVPDIQRLKAEIAELHKLESGRLDKDISSDDLSELQNRLGEIQSRIGEVQSRAGEKQSQIGELQSKIGEQQGRLGEEQGRLGEEQGRLGEQQGRIAEEAERKLRRLFEQTIQDGRAKPVS